MPRKLASLWQQENELVDVGELVDEMLTRICVAPSFGYLGSLSLSLSLSLCVCVCAHVYVYCSFRHT